MAYEYLQKLGLPDAIQSTLQALGARTPGTLLSMIEHSRQKFVNFLGAEQTERLYQALLNIVPAEDREKLKSLPDFKPSFGALLPTANASQNTAARDKRDQLMADIKLLRESDDQSTRKEELLQKLEQQLRDVLKFTVMETRQ